ADEYRLALRRAEAASRLAPDNYNYSAMVGMGRYRVGNYPKAVEILEKADGAYVAAKVAGGGAPWNLAFLAMAYRKLDRVDKAKATLARLRRSMAHPHWSGSEFYRAMLEEAVALISPPPEELPAAVFAPAASRPERVAATLEPGSLGPRTANRPAGGENRWGPR